MNLDRYLDGCEFLWFRVAGWLPSQTLRRVMFRAAGGKLGKGSILYGGIEIRAARHITIGNGCSVGHGAILDGRGTIVIGDNVNISTGAWLWTAEHDIDRSDFGAHLAPIRVHDYVWISGRSTIMPGVTIGRGAVIATGSVVTKNVPESAVVAGVPARVIRMRKSDLGYSLGAGIPFI